jgi:diguanylate cyclase (GGDEF)-like protein
MHVAAKELYRSFRYDHPLSLLMLDIDFFKRVNDKYGHQTGDIVLKMVADSFKTSLRDTDICGRMGGEEFAILLPETNAEKALEIANRLLSTIAATEINLLDTKLQVTVSIGLSALTSNQDSIDLLISKADKALYEAKNTGRNRVRSVY